jgi:hypothetical protein
MDATTMLRNFKETHGLSAEDLSELFDVEVQTIYHWCSGGKGKGVPKKREKQVIMTIENYDGSRKSDRDVPLAMRSFVLDVTAEQLRTWGQATLAKRKLMEDWAIKGLDDLAAEHEAAKFRVAEDEGRYGNDQNQA